MDMKQWYLSRTIWAAVVMILATVLKIFGHDLPADLQGPLTDQLIAGAQIVAGGIAIWGRIRATKAIGAKQ